MSDCFELVPAVDETCCMEDAYLVCYMYENLTLGKNGHVYVTNEQISYHSDKEVTDYHGRFKEEIGRVILKFHWKGDVDKMKTAVLFPCGRRRFRGYDCMGNAIEMTEIANSRWCSRCFAWHTN